MPGAPRPPRASRVCFVLNSRDNAPNDWIEAGLAAIETVFARALAAETWYVQPDSVVVMGARLGVLGEPPWRATPIDTPRLWLREPDIRDANEIFGLLADPKVMEHTDDLPCADVETARVRIGDWLGRAERG